MRYQTPSPGPEACQAIVRTISENATLRPSPRELRCLSYPRPVIARVARCWQPWTGERAWLPEEELTIL